MVYYIYTESGLPGETGMCWLAVEKEFHSGIRGGYIYDQRV